MSATQTVLFVLLAILVVALLMCSCSSKPTMSKRREGYADVFTASNQQNVQNPSFLSRPSFSSNLDPNNLNVRQDPYANANYIRGASTDPENLAAYNQVSTQRDTTQDEMYRPGKFSVSDAANVINYSDPEYKSNVSFKSSKGASSQRVPDSDFADFANLAAENKTQKMKSSKFSSNTSQAPNTLEYTTPSELLPVPDMRQSVFKDPSNPANFMYDRTLFAPLKSRNRNTPDRFRGDLDIEPIKTGWFDISTVPTVDLVKGYFGYFNDIEQYQDLQDISYERSRNESSGQSVDEVNQRLQSSSTAIMNDMTDPKMPYGSLGPLSGPLNQPDNPYYNENSRNTNMNHFL